jgi:hypothetical protein
VDTPIFLLNCCCNFLSIYVQITPLIRQSIFTDSASETYIWIGNAFTILVVSSHIIPPQIPRAISAFVSSQLSPIKRRNEDIRCYQDLPMWPLDENKATPWEPITHFDDVCAGIFDET